MKKRTSCILPLITIMILMALEVRLAEVQAAGPIDWAGQVSLAGGLKKAHNHM